MSLASAVGVELIADVQTDVQRVSRAQPRAGGKPTVSGEGGGIGVQRGD